MLYIDEDNNITLTRGDAFATTVTLTKDDKTYTPTEGETVRFALSKKYVGETGYTLIKDKAIPIDTLLLELSKADTSIPNGVYNYDVEVTHLDGRPDTVISATFTITGECK